MVQRFYQGESRVRVALDGNPKPVLFAIAKAAAGQLTYGSVVRIRETGREGKVLAVRIDDVSSDDNGTFYVGAKL